MTPAKIIVLSLLLNAWANLSASPDYSNCTRLKVSRDTYIKTNGYFKPDLTLQVMYKYDKYVNYTVFRHETKSLDRVIYFMGEPYFWVFGKIPYLWVGHFWYQNKKPELSGPWYTNFGQNNLTVTCVNMREKPKISHSSGISHPKLMLFLIMIKVLVIVRFFRFFAWNTCMTM